jgi:hypothetical protein
MDFGFSESNTTKMNFGFLNQSDSYIIPPLNDTEIATALFLDIYPNELVDSQKPLAQLINFMGI